MNNNEYNFNVALDIFNGIAGHLSKEELEERSKGDIGMQAMVFATRFTTPEKNQTLYNRIYNLYFDYFNKIKVGEQ